MKDKFYLSLGFICLIVIFGIISYRLYNTFTESKCNFCPIELLRLDLSPDKIRVGQTATLIDGLCNHSDDTVNVQMYLGAQNVGATLTAKTIDLLTKTNEKGEMVAVRDTDEGRLPRVLTPRECIANSPIVAPIPSTFSPGMWILRVHIVAIGPTGETQHIDKTSNVFEIIP